MFLRRKILIGSVVSALTVAVMLAVWYAEFFDIRGEVRFLELSDTIRSKTLQLRRHEKNYFLYRSREELENVHEYVRQLREILPEGGDRRFDALRSNVEAYDGRFRRLIGSAEALFAAIDARALMVPADDRLVSYIKTTVFDNPLASSEMLAHALGLPADHDVVRACRELDREIGGLRKTGEAMLAISKDIDAASRGNVERAIDRIRDETFVFFPIFLIVGLGASLLISRGIVRRLRELSGQIDMTSRGLRIAGPPAAPGAGEDEVDAVLMKYRRLEADLAEREYELIESRKLSAIGTLASGVAHELNNPLNNIYTTAQRLVRKAGRDCPPYVEKGLDDILGQSLRVKKIVAELLEFARAREPHRQRIDAEGIVRNAFDFVGNAADVSGVRFAVETPEGPLAIHADPTQMEQVFINLFSNAVDAMRGGGGLTVRIEPRGAMAHVEVADTGAGIEADKIGRIFDPFFSTKERGTGLGLAVVYSIITKNGGEIRVASAEGEGTVFSIDIPAAEGKGE